MTIEEQINEDMKAAMKEKDQVRLAAVRAIKAQILLAKTSGKTDSVTDADVLGILQKMTKQRQESIDIYSQQGRQDLVDEETKQLSFEIRERKRYGSGSGDRSWHNVGFN